VEGKIMMKKEENFILFFICSIILVRIIYAIVLNNSPLIASDTSGYMDVAVDLKDGKLDNCL
jgi:hypothetical protein